MRKSIIAAICAISFMLASIIVCEILSATSQKPVHLTPVREIPENYSGDIFIHAGDHFLWTIED